MKINDTTHGYLDPNITADSIRQFTQNTEISKAEKKRSFSDSCESIGNHYTQSIKQAQPSKKRRVSLLKKINNSTAELKKINDSTAERKKQSLLLDIKKSKGIICEKLKVEPSTIEKVISKRFLTYNFFNNNQEEIIFSIDLLTKTKIITLEQINQLLIEMDQFLTAHPKKLNTDQIFRIATSNTPLNIFKILAENGNKLWSCLFIKKDEELRKPLTPEQITTFLCHKNADLAVLFFISEKGQSSTPHINSEKIIPYLNLEQSNFKEWIKDQEIKKQDELKNGPFNFTEDGISKISEQKEAGLLLKTLRENQTNLHKNIFSTVLFDQHLNPIGTEKIKIKKEQVINLCTQQKAIEKIILLAAPNSQLSMHIDPNKISTELNLTS